MQNAVTSAFDTVTTVEQGVEVLDVFMHLASREVSLRVIICSCKALFIFVRPVIETTLVESDFCSIYDIGKK